MIINNLYKNKYLLLFVSIVFLFFTFLNLRVTAQDYTGIEANINMDSEVIDSYTPPFYEGKALPSKESTVKIIANVEVRTPAGTFDKSKLYYNWSVNDELSHTFSKTGGNVIYVPLSEFGVADSINLQVYSDNTQKTLLAEKTVKITPRNTLPVLYRLNENPIITYANAINKKYQEYKVNKGENFNILAEPFYFSVKSPADKVIGYTWSLNNIPGNKNYSNTYNYTVPDNAFRDFGVGIKITNSDKSLQTNESTVAFVFNN